MVPSFSFISASRVKSLDVAEHNTAEVPRLETNTGHFCRVDQKEENQLISSSTFALKNGGNVIGSIR